MKFVEVTEKIPESVSTTYTLNDNKNSAVAYAKMFALSPHNQAFHYFNENNNTNWANFVSQCVWAGFGGNSAAFGRDVYPMHRSFNGTYDYTGWNYTNSSVFSGAWVRVDAMRNYSILQNASSGAPDPNGLVPTGNRWKGATYTCRVNQMPSIDYAGVVLIHGGSTPNGAYSHAVFAIQGSNGSDIRICANSSDHLDTPLSDLNWNGNTYVHIIVPTQYIFTTAYSSVNFRSNYLYGARNTSLLHSGAEITGKNLYSINVVITGSGTTYTHPTLSNSSYYSFQRSYSTAGTYTITVTVRKTSSSDPISYVTYAKII